MNYYDVKRLALVYAKQAEIEGMKAENQAKKFLKEPITFLRESFEEKANDLINIANCPEDLL